MKNSSYTYKQYVVRAINDDDVSDCIKILSSGELQNQRADKSIRDNDGILIETDGEIIGFATWSIEDDIVSFPVGFIIHYKMMPKHRHSKGSLFLSMVLLTEKLAQYKVYTSGIHPDGFRNMIRQVKIHGRSNRLFKFYRFKQESIDRLKMLKDRLRWEVNTEK
jgi:hypothetical protein